MNEHVTAMAKEFESFRYKHDIHTIFEDWLEMIAITISNRVNLLRFAEREARYLELAKRYKESELNQFAKLMALLINALEEKPNDYLGQLFMHLELFNSWRGQFFTPYEVAKLMSDMTMKTQLLDKLEAGENIRVNDCAVGGGVTLIAAFSTIKELGYNPQQVATFYAQDIDKKAVHMTYIQLSLLGVNAQVFHGNTLTLEHWDTWLSPGYYWGFGKQGKKKSVAEAPVTIEVMAEFEQLALF